MINIAIDGPAGSGKSTAARMLANKLGYVYIDTGAMYRVLTLKAIENNIDIFDKKAMTNLANNTIIELYPGEPQEVYMDKKRVTEEIRRPDVSQQVSVAAGYKEVREKLVAGQQEIALQDNVVMDGRDIGTKVLPNATYKFFIDADIEQRAERRYKELEAKGYTVTKEEIKETLRLRDDQDTSRQYSPLAKADDAILIDTTSLSAQEVVDKMYSIITGG